MQIETLLRAKYDKNFPNLNKFIITIKHRGSPNNTKEIDGSSIKDVTKGHFTLVDGTYIPAHRIIRIKRKR